MDRKKQHGRDRDDMRRDAKSIYNRLRSIEADAEFVSEISDMFPQFPVVANERCGSWYVHPSKLHKPGVYFKSTDGHTGKWDFNLRRYNPHLVNTIIKHGGCILVDSTRKGKRVPDALSKTVPIWCATINTAVQRVAMQILEDQQKQKSAQEGTNDAIGGHDAMIELIPAALDKERWDTRFHSLPSLVSRSEHEQIAERISGFADKLIRFTDLKPLVQKLAKPLRPLWLTPQSVLFADSPPDYSTVDFLPVICLSASAVGQDGFEEREGYLYVQGSGDDDEMWGKGLKPDIFWEHKDWILDDDITPEECEERVIQVVQDHRRKMLEEEESRRQQKAANEEIDGGAPGEKKKTKRNQQDRPLFTPSMELCTAIVPSPLWIGNNTSGRIPEAWDVGFDLVINCGAEIQREDLYEKVQELEDGKNGAASSGINVNETTVQVMPIGTGGATLCVAEKTTTGEQENRRRYYYLHLPIPEGKKGQHKLLEMIPVAIQVVQDTYRNHWLSDKDATLVSPPRILVHCQQGMDRSVGITLALLVACFDEDTGDFRREVLETTAQQQQQQLVNKEIIQRRLFHIMQHRLAARPSRATLKMVNTHFMSPSGEEKAALRPAWYK
ncbi:hypothetical protein BGW41_002678 [Actinomortierella wolfii]|nr:hypothetical protein BGW41_002678 [Actinomortierella wolfii]